MAVARLDLSSRQPYLGGQQFGDAGAYERIDGVLHFAVDPLAAANSKIVDLELAPRDAQGLVHFAADFCLLQPDDPARGSGRLLMDVLNRGRKLMPGMMHRFRAPLGPPSDDVEAGDGLLFRRGWSVAWVGWQWDVIRGPGQMGLVAPQAVGPDGQPVGGQVAVEIQTTQVQADALLANRAHQPYAAARLDDPEAVMTVRDTPTGPRTTIPRAQWQFARELGGQTLPDDSYVRLEGGFQPGRIYEVLYRTRISPVVGTGLLAYRDTASWLRYGTQAEANPSADRIRFAYAFGASQSGRVLRHFLYLGLNRDESGRHVFDGVLPHIAGARRGEFNMRLGQPSVQSSTSLGNLPPYTFDGLLQRQRAVGGVPKIVATNTAAEYWRGDAALLHVSEDGELDLELPAETRAYLFASTQHGGGAVPLTNVNPMDGSQGANPFNAVDYSPLLRAALINLDRWVSEGVPPPPSAVPRLANGTAVPAEQALGVFRSIPGANLPDPGLLPHLPRLDFGANAEKGIMEYPVRVGEPYPALVSAVDSDGNDVAGVRMPDVSVPLATYTGWNPRHPSNGHPEQLMGMQGSTFPFAATPAEGQPGDPRPSIAERYPDREAYLERVRAAAQALVDARYVLAEDQELLEQLAAERYDALASQPAAAGAGVS